jgi:ElaA protein
MMIQFKWYTFSQLSSMQLYQLLMLRSEVFVVEQQCPYLDPDGQDPLALHLLGEKDNTVAAYMRLFLPTNQEKEIFFGRIVISKIERKNGYGKELMQELLRYCNTHYPDVNIKCYAQAYLQKFYETFGFEAIGELFEEDGIPHVLMQKMHDIN